MHRASSEIDLTNSFKSRICRECINMVAVVVVHFDSVFVKEASCNSHEIMRPSLHVYKPFHEKLYIISISTLHAGLFCMLF